MEHSEYTEGECIGQGIYRQTVPDVEEAINLLESSQPDIILCDVDGVLFSLPTALLNLLPVGQAKFLGESGIKLIDWFKRGKYPFTLMTNRRINAPPWRTEDFMKELTTHGIDDQRELISGLNRQVGENGLTSGILRTSGSWLKLQMSIDKIIETSDPQSPVLIAIISDEFAHLQLRKSYKQFKDAYKRFVKPRLGERTAEQITTMKNSIKRRLGFDSFTFYGDYRFAKEVREYALSKSGDREVEIQMVRLNLLSKLNHKFFRTAIAVNGTSNNELLAES